MLKTSAEALRRADRILASAFCLTIAMASAAVAYAPYEDQSAPAVHAIVPKVVAAAIMAKPVVEKPAPVQTARIEVAATPELHATPASYESAAPSVGPSQEELLAQVFLQQGQCLADALYYEARGEGRAGQLAIAEVVYNRMRSGYYPRTICGIVYEGSRHSGCQFSFACSGDMAHRRAPGAWQHAQRLALQIVMGLVKLGDTTDGAMSFHAASVDPSWSDTMARTVQIGHHIFYRPARHSLTRGA